MRRDAPQFGQLNAGPNLVSHKSSVLTEKNKKCLIDANTQD